MRSWLITVLLVLLPIQFTWAAAAPYCQHEQATGSFHLGHHVHEHQPSPAEAWQGDDAQDQSVTADGILTVDNDCGYCHLSVAKPMPMPGVMFAGAGGGAADEMPLESFKSREPDRHERPNWRVA